MTTPTAGAPARNADATSGSGRESWRRTAAWYRAPGAAALGCAFGVAFGRVDLVLLVAPLAIGWVLASSRRAGHRPYAYAEISSDSAVSTRVTDAADAELVSVRQSDGAGSAMGSAVTLAGGGDRMLAAPFDAGAWGERVLARPDTLGAGPDGLYVTGPVRRASATVGLVLPEVAQVSPLVWPPIQGGWTGAHVSRRPGQGSDLVDLREFTPGDRLKSIHWRAYARFSRLYTRRTLSDADAEIMICLDQSVLVLPHPRRVGFGTAGALWTQTLSWVRRVRDRRLARRDPAAFRRVQRARHAAAASSTDRAVAAASGVAAAHLAQGDRVGLITATIPRVLVRAGGGTRQLQRIRRQLARTGPRAQRLLDVAWWGLKPGQLVVWCSPLVSEASARAARQCAARGHHVIVIDTLPLSALLTTAAADEIDRLRILVIERQLRIDGLRGEGIGVVTWGSAGWDDEIRSAARLMRGRR